MNHIKFLTITLAAVTLSSCMQNTKKDESNQSSESPKKEMVKVMQLQYRTVARSVEYPATFEAYEEVHMVPASPGRLAGMSLGAWKSAITACTEPLPAALKRSMEK